MHYDLHFRTNVWIQTYWLTRILIIIELTSFLNSLSIEHFEDIAQKKLLIEVLLGLGKDLELWIKAIFIDQNTDNIHYFDASFANNSIEIDALFHKDEFEEDDDDLEFF